MIRALFGTLTALDPITRAALVRIEQAGIEYEVLLPAYLADRLASAEMGSPVSLRTHHVLETATQGASYVPRLMGFGSESERRFFEVFTTVKGVGARKALKAMARPPGEIAAAIAAKDAKALTALPEIGKRLAETIIAELSGKVDAFVDPGVGGAMVETKGAGLARAPGAVGDAIATLIALGESPADAERRIEAAVARLGGDEHGAEALVQAALGGA